ncbi:MAG: hypothetical protein FWE45_04725 [Firmicutes bacterium]|nr:hypothetical protein [Bacillota bacterium]
MDYFEKKKNELKRRMRVSLVAMCVAFIICLGVIIVLETTGNENFLWLVLTIAILIISPLSGKYYYSKGEIKGLNHAQARFDTLDQSEYQSDDADTI